VESLKAQLEKNPKDQKLIDRAIEIGVLFMARGRFESLAMSTKNGRVVASDANSVFSWPIDGSRPGIRINPGDKVIEAAAFDPTGALVATAHAWDYTVRLWHADGSGLVRELGAATESIEALRFSPERGHKSAWTKRSGRASSAKTRKRPRERPPTAASGGKPERRIASLFPGAVGDRLGRR
jgi:WD40 repeat protein